MSDSLEEKPAPQARLCVDIVAWFACSLQPGDLQTDDQHVGCILLQNLTYIFSISCEAKDEFYTVHATTRQKASL